jgi:1-deoxy-D-xylulose-5-phosphate synthase
MILQDVGILGLHVVFAVDRAGLVGEDGETHHGVFDSSFLRHCPGMTVLCPSSCKELSDMLHWAVEEQNGPVAIRYPRGSNGDYCESAWNGRNSDICVHRSGGKVAIITYGSLLYNAIEAADLLLNRGVQASVIRLMSLSPLPLESLLDALCDCEHVLILEECLEHCGIHDELTAGIRMAYPNVLIRNLNLGDQYITHGKLTDLYRVCGLDAASIANLILEVHQSEN